MKTRSKEELLNALRKLVAQVRGVTRELLVELGEVDACRLYLEEACPSMFAFCTTRLGFSEDVAYKRIQAARLGRRFPAVLRVFGEGRIHLAGLAILGPHVTRENHRERLAAASGLTKRQIEALVADRFPGATPPRRKGTLRRLRATVGRGRGSVAPVAGRGVAARLAPGRVNTGTRWEGEQVGKGSPAPSTGGSKPAGDSALSPAPASPNSTPTEDQSAAGAEALYSLSLTVGKGFADKLEEARAQLSHSLPDGDLACILELGLDALLTDARRRRRAERIQDRLAAASGEEATSTQAERPRPQARRLDAPIDAPAKAPAAAGERRRLDAPASPASPADASAEALAEAPATAGKRRRLDVPAPRVASPADAPFSARAPTALPRPSDDNNTKRSRHITAEVRRRVWARDESRCTYLDGQGRRCGSRWFVQIDHVQPFARGGDNTVTNLRLLCGAHNRQRQATS